MNIFILDECPVQAARDHCNKHVVKMIVETAQLLSTTHRHFDPQTTLEIYKTIGINHPCNKWLRESSNNYIWTHVLGVELCREFTRRYKKVHATEKFIVGPLANVPKMPTLGLTKFAQAMPIQYKHADGVTAYRQYYHGEKARFAVWPTTKPSWWTLP